MQYGICPLSIVSVRANADETSEMVSQLVYGEHFKVLERRKAWSRIRVAFDKFEGWVSNHQMTLISEETYNHIESSDKVGYSSDLISFVETENSVLLPVILGSSTGNCAVLSHTFDGKSTGQQKDKTQLIQTALLYLNAPYLWGGKTPFGIDAAGFTQMVYKINGYRLLRKADQQAKQGNPLSFIEETEAGDLAFFDNSDGEIYHVGIIMENNYIIHVDGKVRIDRIDHTGIFNAENGSYSHKLRVIKKII
ncbi:C40 family peptidase [Zobellia galactanivorans]|uniref:Dipeptidyl peptidase, family C40 n=2 Tax=Zobellia TaxID=112040 RepID=G0L0Y2_ZOBGA|nr:MULTISPECIES: C40 family peptidase [Zobellia]MBU3027023.1 C40 family peptidase [Zobellia galactanivorans]MDO6518977.1 C40 family peptidase [Zobellia uliginosa]MDO6810285.1 C40 family peptidase [Zobellia galactanivorans]OWW23871.1 hydrolase Nlp/P60 [Zobellia sp. OII3]CAZ94537.1 Dipeptidyl peptidase, family C40 [Zobellia galactanivorans]